MSILIKGMEMPKWCWNCPCVNGEYGYCQADKEERQIEDPNERPSWCPIIAASPWHRVEELPKEEGKYLVYDGRGNYHVAWWGQRLGWCYDPKFFCYWMPIEPPKEDA